MMKSIRQKFGYFYSFYVFLYEFFCRSDDFRQISAKTHELLANIFFFGAVAHILPLASILCCWRPYCAVGVPADASTVVG